MLVYKISLLIIFYSQIVLYDFSIDALQEIQYHPIILIPGDGGSRAYMRYGKTDPVYQLWFNLKYMLLPNYLYENFRLFRNKTGHSYVHFPGWGSTETIENLSEWNLWRTKYFDTMVSKILENPFYKRNVTLRGAPYDFRKAPYDNKKFLKEFPKLVEETYRLGNGSKVVLVAHSMGCLYVLHAIRQMSQKWKRFYIESFISIAAPLAGSVKALLLYLSGWSFGIPRKGILYRKLERSFTSTSYLLPKPVIFSHTRTIVETMDKNYTALDYDTLFTDINFKQGFNLFQTSQKYHDANDALNGINSVICVHGKNVDTPSKLVYSGSSESMSFADSVPEIIYDDGDGSVNLNSLQLCRAWYNVKYYSLPGMGHKSILSDWRVIDMIINEAKEVVSKNKSN